MADSPPRRHRISTRPQGSPQTSPRTVRTNPASFDGTLRSTSIGGNASPRGMRLEIPSTSPNVVLKRTPQSLSYPSPASCSSNSVPPSSRTSTFSPSASTSSPTTPYESSLAAPLFYDNQKPAFTSLAATPNSSTTFASTSHLPAASASSSSQLSPRPLGDSMGYSPLSSGLNSARRKQGPPPLMLNRDRTWQGEDALAQPAIQRHPDEIYSGRSTGSEADNNFGNSEDLNRSGGSSRRREDSSNSSPGKSREEERDTLSNLYSFSSPQYDSLGQSRGNEHAQESIPSAPSKIDSPPEAYADSEEPQPPSEDNTATSGFSFLSQSSEGAGLEPSSLHSSTTSSNSNSGSRDYTGLGLGLPFSMSAVQLSTDPSSSFLSTPNARSSITSLEERNLGPESPVTDRSKLIGLGELATPRWTSSVLDRRWGPPSSENWQQEDRRGSATGEEDYSILGGYSESVPRLPTFNDGEYSPTVTRPSGNRQISYESHNGSLSSSMANTSNPKQYPPIQKLQFPTESSLPISGLIDFSLASQHHQAPPPFSSSHRPSQNVDIAPSQQFHDRGTSPAYSLEAVSIDETEGEGLQVSEGTPRKFEDAPVEGGHEQWTRRRSVGAASSAPNTARDNTWTTAAARDVVGLGFEDESGLTPPTSAGFESLERRDSTGSIMKAPPSRRSSIGRTISIDSGKGGHHRRQSASKSGFSHLPPSPATAIAQQPGSGSPLIPLEFPSAALPMISAPILGQRSHSQSSSSAKTPDFRRVSVHSHQSSPSIIAANILRQTRDFDFEGISVDVDMEAAAAADTGTAEALRKLDGLVSQKSSRIPSASSSLSNRNRTSSGSGLTPPAARSGGESAEQRAQRRTRSSTGGSLAPSEINALFEESAQKSPPMPSSATGSPLLLHSPTFGSGPTLQPIITAIPVPRSPLHLHNSTMQQSQFLAYSPRPETNSTSLVSPSKRGSSSSASVNAGTSTSANSGTSRDSTSGTSLSGSSNNAARYLKTRRGSAGSDLSTQSSIDHLALKGDRAESRAELEALQQIPPVPPLPKDWESYRPSTAGTSSSSALNSPNLDAARRPSDGSFLDETATSTPQIAELERYLAASTSVPPPKSPSTRKWSISFGKRSPKATMKGSPSFMDLAQGDQSNFSTFSSQQSSSGPARRMAASSNDIAGLASRGDDTSRLRHSLRADLTRASSIPPRTRTASTSSSSTNRTTVANSVLSVPISISVSTPGRSRSSLLSPRRTPSGIPFFSRKSSSISIPEANTTSASMKDIAVEEKSSSNGRKSILGLNFLRSTSSKKEKEKEKVIPTPVRQTMGGSTTRDTGAVDEFGRRGSVALKTSSLMTRKRGQTLPGEAEEAPRGLGLPPMQMSALSASTARRVDSLSHSASNSSLSKKPVNTRIQPPLKSSRNVQDSPKDSLPTINGSPSSQAFPSSSDRANQVERLLDSGSTTPPLPPKSQTPTKIPRLYGRSSVTSPRLPASSIRSYASSVEGDGPPAVPASSTKPSRRSSTYGPSQPSDLSSSINFPSESDGDFAVNREPGLAPGERTLSTRRRLDADTSGIPRSQSNAGSGLSSSRTYRVLGDVASPPDSRAGTAIPRTHRRTSLLSSEETRTTSAIQTPRATALANQMRSSLSESTPSIASASVRRALSKPAETSRASDVAALRRASVAPESTIPFSTTARNLPSKMAIPSRVSPFSATAASPSDTRRSRESTKSPAYDEEAKGDEEMAAYVRRQHTKKMAAGISADTIKKMFEFPDPTQPLPPLNSRDASALYSRFLSEFELEEIQSFKQIYFVGPNCEKKMATKDNPTNNFGYDDERGDYLLVPHDHILYRYETIDVLGKGSFGQVLQCRDHKTGDMVAIKIIRNKKRFHHQALVEIKVLENLVKWDPDEKHFVIRMVDSFTFRGHLCIVTELLSINLYELVKANSFAGFSTILIRRFTMQILASLSLLRHHRVVHCDLKPENILLKHPAKSAIKVIDFGSSCFEHEKVYTYIQSRFYRSPEVILGMNYHMAIDMWSLGCIIAEMFTGYPIFPGENEQEQLACIMEVMGLPDKYLVDRSSRKRLFFDSTGAPRPVVNSKGRRRRPATKTLAQVLKSDDELFVDFIAKCLIWDPERRLKPDAGARHPWMVAARKRAPSPMPPIRSARSSYAAASLSSSISTPLRKVGPSSGSISSNSSSFSSTLPSRIRTASTTSTRLPSKVSLGASAASASRFPVS